MSYNWAKKRYEPILEDDGTKFKREVIEMKTGKSLGFRVIYKQKVWDYNSVSGYGNLAIEDRGSMRYIHSYSHGKYYVI